MFNPEQPRYANSMTLKLPYLMRYNYQHGSRHCENYASRPKRLQLISIRRMATSKPAMFIRAYLRASSDDYEASRIAATYVENPSGALLDRRELLRLLADAEPEDVLFVEAVDRLSRLDRATWDRLRDRIARAGL